MEECVLDSMGKIYKENGNDFLCRHKSETLKHVKRRANDIVSTSVDNGWTLQISVR